MSNSMLTLKELHEILPKLGKNDLVLDVRNPDEFKEARIAHARNIPVPEVTQHAEELKKFENVYIHCKRGGRAKTAFEALKNVGLNNLVCVHDAGMEAWIESGYPVERG